MKISIKEIASLIDGKISGDDTLEISNVAKIEDAKPGELNFSLSVFLRKIFFLQQKLLQ